MDMADYFGKRTRVRGAANEGLTCEARPCRSGATAQVLTGSNRRRPLIAIGMGSVLVIRHAFVAR